MVIDDNYTEAQYLYDTDEFTEEETLTSPSTLRYVYSKLTDK